MVGVKNEQTPRLHMRFKPMKKLVDLLIPGLLAASVSNSAFAGTSDVELKVWQASKAELADLETESVLLIQKDPESAYAHYVVALLYLRQFKADPAELRYLKQASDLGQQAIELQPAEEYGYLIASQVLDLMGYGESSISMLEEKDRIRSQRSWRSSFVKGLLMMDQAANDDILSQFEKALQVKEAPRDVIVPYVTVVLQTSVDGKELVEELTSWNERFPSHLFQQSLAGALSSVKRYADAHQVYAKVRAAHPEKVIVTLSDAVLLYSQLDQSKEAETMFQSVLNSKHAELEHRNIAKAHLAAIYLKAGQQEKARSYFADVISESSESMEWISFAHKAYERNNALGNFVTLLEDLRMRLPGSSFVYALQGEVLSEDLSQHQKAIESYADAVLLDPRRSDFYNGMGLAYYRMQQHELALSTFHKALSVDPKDATARYNEACVLSIMGRSNEALDSLKAAISLDSRLQEIASHDKDFENIRKNAQFQSLVQMSKTTRVP